MTYVIERAILPTLEVEELITELNDILAQSYSADQRHGLSLDELFEPHVRFFLARLAGEAVACGGVAIFDGYAEVKRMYTRPAVRGRGLAKALLRRIEEEARAAGVPVLRLETGVHQPEAIGLYEATGFRSCGPFGPYAAMPANAIELSLFYEKALT